MLINFEQKSSDSPVVEWIWRSHSEESGPFTSLAMSRWIMVVSKFDGKSMITVRGPETVATKLDVPANGDWVGIYFKIGTVMPHLPASQLLNTDQTLPAASANSFYLNGCAWEYPTYENADTFVARLVREGLIVQEPVVDAALQGHLKPESKRTAQRYFQRTTGLTHSDVRQIERARYATMLLRQGMSILDTVYAAGYFDQPHLNRSLKRYVGFTPTQIMDQRNPEQLSFLYKPQLLP